MPDTRKHLEAARGVIYKSRDQEAMFANYVLTFSTFLSLNQPATVFVQMTTSRLPVEVHLFQEFVVKIQGITFT